MNMSSIEKLTVGWASFRMFFWRYNEITTLVRYRVCVVGGFFMKKKFIRAVALVTSLIIVFTTGSFSAFAASVTYNQIVNAAMSIIIQNEGNYSSVVRNDNGALSIGKIQWHGTNALNLLKDIVSRNPTQALSILGSSLYNEIVSSSTWETKIPSVSEASAISVLISTTEGKKVQDEYAYEYISGYVDHAIALGITDPAAMVFFADYQNQFGYTGASNFYSTVLSTYGTVTLQTLYYCSSQNSRRTTVYNYCLNLDWDTVSSSIYSTSDNEAPEISNVVISNLTNEGYTVSCEVSDNTAVTAVYFAVYYLSDGEDGMVWYEQTPTDGSASHTVNISDFSSRHGEYCTIIYAFDAAGNYAYAELNTITVEDESDTSGLSVTVSSSISTGQTGSTIRWSAAASGGSGNYSYSFFLYKDGEYISTRGFLDYSDYSYKVSETGEYYVVVIVSDSTLGVTATTQSSITDICDPIEVNSIEANKTAAILGESIIWTVDATGGGGTLYYQFTVYNNDEIVYSTSYDEENVLYYKTTAGGVYKVVATVIDTHSQAGSITSESITVVAPLTVGDPEFSKSYTVVGGSVTCTVDISGGIGIYSCNFTIYCDGEVVSTGIREEGEYTFTATESGTYTAVVDVNSDKTDVSVSGGELTVDSTAQQGDANCDGSVNISDARFVLRVAAKLEACETELEYAADVNGDDKVSISDARLLLRVIAKLDTF